MSVNINLQDITEEQAVEAGAICGALAFGYLWRIQHDAGGTPATLPFQQKAARKKYVSATGAAEILGVSRSSFYKKLREAEIKKDDSFPKRKMTVNGERFATADVESYDRKLKNKKA